MIMDAEYGFVDRPVCPDCRDGKHRACVGAAWDAERDQPATCWCWTHDHNAKELEKWI